MLQSILPCSGQRPLSLHPQQKSILAPNVHSTETEKLCYKDHDLITWKIHICGPSQSLLIWEKSHHSILSVTFLTCIPGTFDPHNNLRKNQGSKRDFHFRDRRAERQKAGWCFQWWTAGPDAPACACPPNHCSLDLPISRIERRSQNDGTCKGISHLIATN